MTPAPWEEVSMRTTRCNTTRQIRFETLGPPRGLLYGARMVLSNVYCVTTVFVLQMIDEDQGATVIQPSMY